MSNDAARKLGAVEKVVPFGADNLILSTGKVAKQANATVVATVGGTTVLASVVMAGPRPEPLSFFPLTVEYRERMYAGGRIPGGYFKREGRPTEAEVLTARLIDRPLRPMFPDGFSLEVQVFITVVSYDGKNSPDVVGMCAASTALIISDIPFEKPIAGVRVGFDGTDYILNPAYEDQKNLKLDLIVAGTKNAIVMVESGAEMLTEEQMLGALKFGHDVVVNLCQAQEELRKEVGKPKSAWTKVEHNATLLEKIRSLSQPKFAKINEIYEKHERAGALDEARDEIIDSLTEEFPEVKEVMKAVFEDEYSQSMRLSVLDTNTRADGRKLDEIRDITIDVDVLPRTHGSALFTRGQTQSLGVLTLGTGEDTQELDWLEGRGEREFYMHYNFPSYSVGEVRPIRGPGRREIGHGALAERSIKPIIPTKDKFPYTVRLVSEILESNGSSSMASVCSGCLALMDGGVPIKAPVAGIAMGLILEGDRYAVLSDIMGLEDHLGDMDFKVAGTLEGITALQMDIKIEGVTLAIMEKALAQARDGRKHILGKMNEILSEPRAELNEFAPRIEMIMINPERIRDVIGAGGKVIREITASTGAKIDINDTGQVFIASADGEAMKRAIKWVRDLTTEAELGQVYTGKVNRIEDFGAFIEILPGKDGLVHVSELEPHRVDRVTDVINIGDEVLVKVIGIDDRGKIRLSRKAAMYPDLPPSEPQPRGDRGDRGGRGGDRDRGGRGGDRDRGGRGGDRDRGGRGGDRDRGPRGGDRDRGTRSDRPARDRAPYPSAPREGQPEGGQAPKHDGDDDIFERPAPPPAFSNEVEDELSGN